MAKEQKRGNKEKRKPKQEPKPVAASPAGKSVFATSFTAAKKG